MRILIEGPDGSGKTTLCDELVKRGYHYIHLSKPEGDVDEYMRDASNESTKYDNVIIDRGVISNLVYSTIFKDTSIISSDVLYDFIAYMDLIILAIPSDKGRYLSDFDKLKTSREELYNDMEKIYDAYSSQKLFKDVLYGKKVIMYDMYKVSKCEIPNYVDSILI